MRIWLLRKQKIEQVTRGAVNIQDEYMCDTGRVL